MAQCAYVVKLGRAPENVTPLHPYVIMGIYPAILFRLRNALIIYNVL